MGGYDRWLTYETFSKNLRSLVDSKGISGKQLAEEIGTTSATISRYLTGVRDPDLEYVYRLSQYFGVSIDWLLGCSPEKWHMYREKPNGIAELYSRASKDDQMVIDAVLKKYEGK